MDCSFLVSYATTQLTVGNVNILVENGLSGDALRIVQRIYVNELVAFNTHTVLLAIKEAVRTKGWETGTEFLLACSGCGRIRAQI
jgi:hypothetical protein